MDKAMRDAKKEEIEIACKYIFSTKDSLIIELLERRIKEIERDIAELKEPMLDNILQESDWINQKQCYIYALKLLKMDVDALIRLKEVDDE